MKPIIRPQISSSRLTGLDTTVWMVCCWMSLGRLRGTRMVTIAVKSSEQSKVRVATKSRPISAARGGWRNQWVKASTSAKTMTTTHGAHILRFASWTLNWAIE